MEHLKGKSILLLNLLNPKLTSRRRIKTLESIEVINSYELVFVLCAIIQYKFSGNLIIISKENELSGMVFIDGDIVSIDYPDQENLLGNLIVKDEKLSKFEMGEILKKLNGKKLGEYLVENNYLSSSQLKSYLFAQANSRLTKYMSESTLRINFNFDGESSENAVIHGNEYYQMLYCWIFNLFTDEWLEKYRSFYSPLNFMIVTENKNEVQLHFKSFQQLSQFFNTLKAAKKKDVTYYELIAMLNVSAEDEVRLVHFMVLIGVLVENKQVKIRNSAAYSAQFKEAKYLILRKKYFDAAGILKKISSSTYYDEKVHFYFLWIKLHGAFYNNNVVDLAKINKEILAISINTVGAGDYNYARALVAANLKNSVETENFYKKAVECDNEYVQFPISKLNNDSIWSTFRKFIGS